MSDRRRKGYAIVRPASRQSRTLWRYAFFGTGGRDAYGRWSWQETKFVLNIAGHEGFIDAASRDESNAKLLRQQENPAVAPMILPLFPFTVGQNFHQLFRTTFSDTGKTCWIDAEWFGWTINATTYGIGGF